MAKDPLDGLGIEASIFDENWPVSLSVTRLRPDGIRALCRGRLEQQRKARRERLKKKKKAGR